MKQTATNNKGNRVTNVFPDNPSQNENFTGPSI